MTARVKTLTSASSTELGEFNNPSIEVSNNVGKKLAEKGSSQRFRVSSV